MLKPLLNFASTYASIITCGRLRKNAKPLSKYNHRVHMPKES